MSSVSITEGNVTISIQRRDIRVESSVRAIRTAPLLTEFRDGFAVGFFFAVPDRFQEALDITNVIRETQVNYLRPQSPLFRSNRPPLLVETLSYTAWLQGREYAFREGDVIYDDSAGYLCRWSEALQKVTVALQVLSARPAAYVLRDCSETATSSHFVSSLRILDEGRQRRYVRLRPKWIKYDPGLVTFRVSRTNKVRTALVPDSGVCTVSQAAFVALLRLGYVPGEYGGGIDLVGSP